jgi:ATP-dependent Clp protease protease subunit
MKKHDLLRTALFTKGAAALIPDEVRGDERSFKAETSADGSSVEVDLYDLVWPWEAKRMKNAIPADAKRVHMRVNSPGGDMFAGIAIYNLLKNHSAHVTVEVDGLAASAASIAVMGGDHIRMNRGAFLMVHEPWIVAVGGADDLREMASTMDKFTKEMVALYADRSGLPEKELAKMMAAETWLSGDEAVEKGLADEAAEEPAAKAAGDLSVFAHVPESLRAAAQQDRPGFTVRAAERALRDAGATREQAKAILASGFKATPDPREAAGNEPDSAAAERLMAKMLNLRMDLSSRALART